MARIDRFRLFVLSLGLTWAALPSSAVIAAESGRPPVADFVVEARTGTVKFEINIFDEIKLVRGKPQYVRPTWTDGMQRPVNREMLSSLTITPFHGDQRAKISIPVERVQDIVYWETMAISRIDQLWKNNKHEEAEELLAELRKFNPTYRPTDLKRLSIQIDVDRVKQLTATENQANVAQGLILLDELLSEHGHTDEMETAYSQVCIALAEKAYKRRKYAEMHDHVNRLGLKFPASLAWFNYRNTLVKRAKEVLSRAKQEEDAGNPRKALALADAARRIAPVDDIVRREHDRLLRAYQILSIACYEDAGAFEPFNATRALEKQIVRLVYDSLFEPDETGREFFKGAIVKSFQPKALGTQYNFELRRGVFFSNGQQLTAQDVMRTVTLLRDRAGEAFDSEWSTLVTGVKVQGPFSFTVTLRQHPRAPDFLTFPVASSQLKRLPVRGAQDSLHPIGTGPFRLSDKVVPPGVTQLVANERFRHADENRPYVKEMNFRRYVKKGTGVAINDLLNGQLHMLSDPSSIQLGRLKAAPHLFSSKPFLSDSVWVLAFNHRKPIFQDRGVRRAVLLAIERQKILTQYFMQGGLARHKVVSGPFPPHSNAYDPALPLTPPNPVTAKALIAKAGPIAKVPVSLKYATGDITIELAVQTIRRNLKDVGLTVTTVPKLPNDLIQEVAIDHNFDLVYWRIDHNNILFNLAWLFDVSPAAVAPGGANLMGFEDPELTQLFDDLRREMVGDKIWNTQHQIHRRLHQQVAVVPLWWLESYVVHTTRLVGKADDGKNVELPISRKYLFRRSEDWYLEPEK